MNADTTQDAKSSKGVCETTSHLRVRLVNQPSTHHQTIAVLTCLLRDHACSLATSGLQRETELFHSHNNRGTPTMRHSDDDDNRRCASVESFFKHVHDVFNCLSQGLGMPRNGSFGSASLSQRGRVGDKNNSHLQNPRNLKQACAKCHTDACVKVRKLHVSVSGYELI